MTTDKTKSRQTWHTQYVPNHSGITYLNHTKHFDNTAMPYRLRVVRWKDHVIPPAWFVVRNTGNAYIQINLISAWNYNFVSDIELLLTILERKGMKSYNFCDMTLHTLYYTVGNRDMVQGISAAAVLPQCIFSYFTLSTSFQNFKRLQYPSSSIVQIPCVFSNILNKWIVSFGRVYSE